MVQSIIYKSKAQPTFNITEVREMLLRAKNFNKKNNITGLIIYYNSYFIQLIEGEKEKINSLYHNIQSDDRHFDVKTILNQRSPQSLWNSWSMAFYDLSEKNEQTNYLRMLLDSNFENASLTEKNSDVFFTLKKNVFDLLNN